MTIDPRLAERRRSVAEQRIRSNLRRLVWLLVAVGLVAAGVWTLNSPLFSVTSIEISGVVASNAEQVVSEAGVEPGVPLISLDTTSVEEAIETDPRVVSAAVSRNWPQTVVVEVQERFPVAWVVSPAGSVHVAADGVVIEVGSRAVDAPMVRTFTQEALSPGQAIIDPVVLGGIEFLDALRADLAEAAVVDATGAELTATVAGFRVRLGFPSEMASKAAVLAAVVDSEPEEGSEITLLAPERPAVLEPSATTTTTTAAPEDG